MEDIERELLKAVTVQEGQSSPIVQGMTLAALNRDGEDIGHLVPHGADSDVESSIMTVLQGLWQDRGRLNVTALTTESTFWIASMTKIVTSIAAMQCVERGLLTLDGGITTVLLE